MCSDLGLAFFPHWISGAWAKSHKESGLSYLAPCIHYQPVWPAKRQELSPDCLCPASLIELLVQHISQAPSLWRSVSKYGPTCDFPLCMHGLLLTSGEDTSLPFHLGWPRYLIWPIECGRTTILRTGHKAALCLQPQSFKNVCSWAIPSWNPLTMLWESQAIDVAMSSTVPAELLANNQYQVPCGEPSWVCNPVDPSDDPTPSF